MSEALLHVLPAHAWPDHVAGRLAERLAARPGLRLCLPTGSTPRAAYAALPAAMAAAGSTLAGATVVLLDEYVGLPAGHPARCDQQLRRDLLDRLAAPPQFLGFEVDGGDPARACEATASAIRQMGGLDLVLLGLGMNGHVGMNEPGTPAGAQTRVVELAAPTREAARGYGADPPPIHGVTLGLAEILAADEIWLLVAGAHKAGILASVLDGDITPSVPASMLRHHGRLQVIADETAALNATGAVG